MKNDAEKLKSHWFGYQNTGSFISLWIFLEQSLDEAKEVNSSLNFEPFPYSGLIDSAIRSESDYWATLAVDWLEKGFPIDEKIVEAINLMTKSKWASQKTRHRAFRLVKGFERSNSTA
jgi:hypothetical protein